MNCRLRNHFGGRRLTRYSKQNNWECQIYTDKPTKEPQSILDIQQKAWEQVALVLFGPIPNNKHFTVAQVSISKILPDTKAVLVIPAIDEIYVTYGYLGHITDNGQPFGSNEFQYYSKETGMLSWPAKHLLAWFRDTSRVGTGVSPADYLFREGYQTNFPISHEISHWINNRLQKQNGRKRKLMI